MIVVAANSHADAILRLNYWIKRVILSVMYLGMGVAEEFGPGQLAHNGTCPH